MPTQQARSYFPRGLFQPSGSFRFSADALLLACFASQCLDTDHMFAPSAPNDYAGHKSHAVTRQKHLLDLGCGCGAVALGVMLRHPSLNACGVDVQPELLEAADKNAAMLGFSEQYRSICSNLEERFLPFGICENRQLEEGAFQLVTANPPYRLPGSGRVPASAARRTALFGCMENLSAFVRVAAKNLHPAGSFCIIFPWERREDLRVSLEQFALFPVRGVTVRAKSNSVPSLLLLQAKKISAAATQHGATQKHENSQCAGGLETEYPVTSLVLHEKNTKTMIFTDEALKFCPYLSCNSGRSQPAPPITETDMP